MRPQPLYTGTGPSDGLFTTARAVWAVVDNACALARSLSEGRPVLPSLVSPCSIHSQR